MFTKRDLLKMMLPTIIQNILSITLSTAGGALHRTLSPGKMAGKKSAGVRYIRSSEKNMRAEEGIAHDLPV